MENDPAYASIAPVIPYGTIGATIAFTPGAICFAIATGAVMSAPLLITPCGSSVPVGRITVLTFDGTSSLSSIQLMSERSRVEGESAELAARKSPSNRAEAFMIPSWGTAAVSLPAMIPFRRGGRAGSWRHGAPRARQVPHRPGRAA